MWTRGVAPATIVGRQGVIGWAKVGGGYEDGGVAGVAVRPTGLVDTLDLKACAAAEAIIEECGAESGRLNTVSLTVQIPVTTSTSYTHTSSTFYLFVIFVFI